MDSPTFVAMRYFPSTIFTGIFLFNTLIVPGIKSSLFPVMWELAPESSSHVADFNLPVVAQSGASAAAVVEVVRLAPLAPLMAADASPLQSWLSAP
mmetsp:Transcript_10169/g.15371  ORF Transcript_10169/g.15371 Transcript_10169/m.15371 type:complete len:96 (-) Transcript_10169:131-418(-)